jgi:predicted transcriptional regulator
MKEIYVWQISPEELRVIKLALQGKITKRSPLWNQAQAIAKEIKLDVSQDCERTYAYGLTEDIIYALEQLGKATVTEIAEYLGTESNSISSITSKLYKSGEIQRIVLSEEPRKGRGVQARYVYYLTDYETTAKNQSSC